MVVWIDGLTPTNRDILAQRFNSAGDKVGPEIVVSNSSLNDTEPAVAMDSQGDFVVSWTQTQLNGDTNVLARKFDSAGNPQGAIVPVGVHVQGARVQCGDGLLGPVHRRVRPRHQQ